MPETVVSPWNQHVVEEFRAREGRVGGPFEGGELLLLTTTGRTTGTLYTVPLGVVRDGERLLVVGSAGGAPEHPAWYRNVLAHPAVQVELGAEGFGAVAVPVAGPERERLWPRIVAAAPGFADYQATLERELPVVALERVPEPAGVAANFSEHLARIHAWLRDGLRQTRIEAEALAGPGAGTAALGLRLRAHCLAFCEGLHAHHSHEDEAGFPYFEQLDPALRPVIERLRAEHVVVERLRTELLALLDGADGSDPARFRRELDRLAESLEAHLDHEESALRPTLEAIPMPGRG